MRISNKAKLTLGVLLGATALASPVLATTSATLTGGVVTPLKVFYPSVGTGGVVVIPSAQQSLTITPSSTVAVTGNQSAQILTITLPTGSTFANTPTITVASTSVGILAPVTSALAGTLSASANSVTYSLTTSTTSATAGNVTNATISFSTFTIAGATTLASASTKYTLTAQMSGSGSDGAALTDSGPVSIQLASTTTAYVAVASQTAGLTSDSISISTTSPGATKFVSSAGVESNYARLGTLGLSSPNTLELASSTSLFGGESAVNVTVSGVLGPAITGGFLAAGSAAAGASCNATTAAASSSITGTLTTSGATTTFSFTGASASVAAQFYSVCVVANGTTTITPTGVPSASVTGYLPTPSSIAASDAAGNLSGLTYVTGTSELDFPYIATASAGFDTFIRIANQSSSSQTVYGVFRTETGTVYPGIVATIAAQTATLIGTGLLQTALGATSLAPATRGSLSLFGAFSSTTGGSLVATPLQYSPSGVVSSTNRAQ